MKWLKQLVLGIFPSCDCETFVKLRWDRMEHRLPLGTYLRTQVHRLECEECNDYCCKVTDTERELKRAPEAPNLSRAYKMSEETQQRLKDSVADFGD